jgi:hypothetical protein
MGIHSQGDQIGRIFAYILLPYFVQVFCILCTSRSNFLVPFSHIKNQVRMFVLIEMGCATFLPIFLQAYLVTLLTAQFLIFDI